jgi:hypothetical protein
MTDEPTQILAASLRRDMRELAFRMTGLTTAMEGMRDEMRDMRGRLNDVIAQQVTKGDLEVIHFELNRFIDRLDAIEAQADGL